MKDFKEIKTKIALKQNSYQYWTTSNETTVAEGTHADYIPLYGEVCFCEIPAYDENNLNNGAAEVTNPPTVLFKVGTAKFNEDGSYVAGTNKKFSELSWASALAADVYDWAKMDEDEAIDWITGLIEIGDGLAGEVVVGEDGKKLRTISHGEKPTTGTEIGEKQDSATIFVSKITIDEFGHIAGVETAEVIVPNVSWIDSEKTSAAHNVNANEETILTDIVAETVEKDGEKTYQLTGKYTKVPTKKYVDEEIAKKVASAVQYLGTVASKDDLATDAGKGDFYRAIAEFRFVDGGELVHVGDMLIATKDNPTRSETDWDIAHLEVDTDTWQKNSKTADGYVTKGEGQLNKVWKTDGEGNPGWGDLPSGTGTATIAENKDGVVTLKGAATLSGHVLGNSGNDVTLKKIATTASAYDLEEANTGKDKDGKDILYFVLDCNW